MAGLYDDYHKQALDLEYRFRDTVDNLDAPQMQTLQREIHNLTEDLKAAKSPRHIEDRIKTIERQLLQTREQGDKLLSYQDVDSLQQKYRKLREHVRTMPDY